MRVYTLLCVEAECQNTVRVVVKPLTNGGSVPGCYLEPANGVCAKCGRPMRIAGIDQQQESLIQPANGTVPRAN